MSGSLPRKVAAAAGLALAILAVTWLVYATGGVRFSYAHLMYVPVVLGGIAFGVPGGALTAVGAGLALGPFMPINTTTGEMQDPLNWVYRMVFFAAVGVLVGAWAQRYRHQLRQVEWLHEHQEETGLLNSAGLLKELDALLSRAGPDQRFIVSMAQLNNFLAIQNTFGSGFGRQVLAAVVDRSRSVIPASSLVALIQSDRLATVVEDVEAVQLTRGRLESAIAESYIVDGVPIHVEASIGIATFPEHGRTGEELLQKASIAMHWAAMKRATISVYDPTNDRTSRDNLTLLGAVPAAIRRGEFQVWHQAKLDLATGEIVGTEALLRWNHPSRGFVQPGSFIPPLEETMLINPVTHVVIDAAFAAAGAWRAAGYRLRVSVNLSVRNLLDRTLIEVLEEACRNHGLRPGDTELEITESAVMSDPEHCIRLVGELRDRGYGVAIDDFGVGHSSLSYLQKLRGSTLKIDREFVGTLATDRSNQKIVRSILNLAESLGLQTVAEGVEDVQALDLLREWGCDQAQGYAIHRPAPAEEVSLMLAERARLGRQSVSAEAEVVDATDR
ncbi:MAG TPA: bifunctional diguanylate cyclase/phosphodiesterase [Microlunatus sp.]|nr:bifunctional diguanylate cyclase/phosphodiesterase [Microlunatus sp.]